MQAADASGASDRTPAAAAAATQRKGPGPGAGVSGERGWTAGGAGKKSVSPAGQPVRNAESCQEISRAGLLGRARPCRLHGRPRPSRPSPGRLPHGTITPVITTGLAHH